MAATLGSAIKANSQSVFLKKILVSLWPPFAKINVSHISSSSFPLVTSIRIFDLNIQLFYPKLQKGKRAEQFYELMGFLYYVYGWRNPHKGLSMFLKILARNKSSRVFWQEGNADGRFGFLTKLKSVIRAFGVANLEIKGIYYPMTICPFNELIGTEVVTTRASLTTMNGR